jgi:diketogulonate reductase-like aldo/keto reductase
VRIASKRMLGSPSPEVLPKLEHSIERTLVTTKLQKIDVFFLHGQIVPDAAAGQVAGTPRRLFVDSARPACEQLVTRDLIGAWGISAIGEMRHGEATKSPEWEKTRNY